MKKLLLVYFFLGIGVLLAQITIPTTAEIDYPGGPGLQMGYTPEGYTALKLQQPSSFTRYVARTINPDSIQNQRWTLSVEKLLSTTPYKYELLLDGFLLNDPSQRLTYRDTIDLSTAGGYLAVPDRDNRVTAAYGSPFPFTQDSIWRVYWNMAIKPATGTTNTWIFSHIRPIAVDSAGRQEVHVIPFTTDSLNTY